MFNPAEITRRLRNNGIQATEVEILPTAGIIFTTISNKDDAERAARWFEQGGFKAAAVTHGNAYQVVARA